ncbi:MAG: hypothetical protein KME03_08860 [Aphanocapsa lilacina HA4352-LM1]|jgi:hypothetical protein|nr:hypothetical protein [Aphanocapsa lilacina HA4352-LM1]
MPNVRIDQHLYKQLDGLKIKLASVYGGTDGPTFPDLVGLAVRRLLQDIEGDQREGLIEELLKSRLLARAKMGPGKKKQ